MRYGVGGHNRKRVTVEACARIDAAMLRRAGLFDPSGPRVYFWPYVAQRGPSCTVIAFGADPDSMTLAILPKATRPPVKDGVLDVGKLNHLQRVRISYTDCNYGKHRAWLHCPICGRRVFRLFYYDHTFNGGQQVHYLACRHCYGLTYEQRRNRGFNRYQDRADAIRRKLIRRGAKELEWMSWRALPLKPKGMHWRTYERYVEKFEAACHLANRAFVTEVSKHIGGI